MCYNKEFLWHLVWKFVTKRKSANFVNRYHSHKQTVNWTRHPRSTFSERPPPPGSHSGQKSDAQNPEGGDSHMKQRGCSSSRLWV